MIFVCLFVSSRVVWHEHLTMYPLFDLSIHQSVHPFILPHLSVFIILNHPFNHLSILVPAGYSTNVYTGRLRPEVQPLTLLYTIFHEKSIPFVYLLLINGTPFTYLV